MAAAAFMMNTNLLAKGDRPDTPPQKPKHEFSRTAATQADDNRHSDVTSSTQNTSNKGDDSAERRASSLVHHPLPVVPESAHEPVLPVESRSQSPPVAKVTTHWPRKTFLTFHKRKVIDKKWEAKEAIMEKRYHEKCAKIAKKHDGKVTDGPIDLKASAKRQKAQQKADTKYLKKKSKIAHKYGIEKSLAEGQAYHKAEKKRLKTTQVENPELTGPRK